jgi:hypothetical protein
MRSIRFALLVTGALLAFGMSAVPVDAASTPHELHIVKDCGTNTGIPPTYCSISTSSLKVLAVHARVWYLGPVLSDAYFLSSNIKIDAWHGNTATGYCQVDAKTATGLCTFWKGTGTLAGFHAVLQVSVDSRGLWHWDGIYYFAGQS